MPDHMTLSIEHLQQLAATLRHRLQLIADHEFRDRDPQAHLEALKSVSEQINAFLQVWRPQISPQLRHFLANASYQKALDWIEDKLAPTPPQ